MDYSLNKTDLVARHFTGAKVMNERLSIATGEINKEYRIKAIKAEDQALIDFLFTLGCYEGETITIISVLTENYVVSVKDARYSIDTELAEAIII